jgi:hypothetical protein
MILWSSRKLEHALAVGQLDPWTKVKYLLVPVVMGIFSGPFYILRPVYGQKPPPIYSLVSFICAVLSAFIAYWGIKICFSINNKIDGNRFFERLAVLTVPVLIKVAVFFFSFSLIFVVVFSSLKDRVSSLFQWTYIIISALNPIVTYTMYSMIRNSFERFGRLVERMHSQPSRE